MAEDAHSDESTAVAPAHGSEHSVASVDVGLAVVPAPEDAFQDPGLPPHHLRVTDTNPRRQRRAQRTVFSLFYLSIAGSIFAVAAYMAFPIEDGSFTAIRINNLFIGLGIALALLGLGFGAVHWAKALMGDHELTDPRHPVRGSEETRARSIEIFQQANEESGFGRRTLIRNTLIGALIAFPLPAVAMLRGLAPQNQDPVALLKETMWDKGVRLVRDPLGTPIKASDVTLGSVFHVIPDGLNKLPHDEMLNAKAKAIVLLVRMDPSELHETPERKSWSYDGIVAYSKVCTHVGCPVALYEQQTHHLLCPCHQSQFDISNGAAVIFGPAARPLPQLPIAVDDEGYLVAQSDFTEPVGPSFWERDKA